MVSVSLSPCQVRIMYSVGGGGVRNLAASIFFYPFTLAQVQHVFMFVCVCLCLSVCKRVRPESAFSIRPCAPFWQNATPTPIPPSLIDPTCMKTLEEKLHIRQRVREW